MCRCGPPGAVMAPPADRDQALARFVGRFDGGEYWLAHEELEALWLQDRRDVYKGLIHLAAACLHLERDNLPGARTKLASARELIASDDADEAAAEWLDRSGLLTAIGDLEARAPTVLGRRPELRLAPFVNAPGLQRPLADEDLPYRVTRYDEGYRPGRDPRRRD